MRVLTHTRSLARSLARLLWDTLFSVCLSVCACVCVCEHLIQSPFVPLQSFRSNLVFHHVTSCISFCSHCSLLICFKFAHSQHPSTLFVTIFHSQTPEEVGSGINVFRQHFSANELVCLPVQICDIKKNECECMFFLSSSKRKSLFYILFTE